MKCRANLCVLEGVYIAGFFELFYLTDQKDKPKRCGV